LQSTALRFVIVVILITLMDTIFIGGKVRMYCKRLTARISDADKTGEINFFAIFLSAWDYSLTSETAVKVQHRTIARDFNVSLHFKGQRSRIQIPNPVYSNIPPTASDGHA